MQDHAIEIHEQLLHRGDEAQVRTILADYIREGVRTFMVSPAREQRHVYLPVPHPRGYIAIDTTVPPAPAYIELTVAAPDLRTLDHLCDLIHG